jgi:hypothetical protein
MGCSMEINSFIKIDYYNGYWSLRVSVIKMRLWPYYTNVYYKYRFMDPST